MRELVIFFRDLLDGRRPRGVPSLVMLPLFVCGHAASLSSVLVLDVWHEVNQRHGDAHQGTLEGTIDSGNNNLVVVVVIMIVVT